MAAETPEFVALSAAVTQTIALANTFLTSSAGFITGIKDADAAALEAAVAALPAILDDADTAIEALEDA